MGELGPVRLWGTWDNLALAVSKLPLVVGEVAGTGSLRGGRLSADLAYTSPYAAFPVAVRQQGSAWLLSSPYARGRYANNVFTLSVNGQPLTLIEPLQLFGQAVYRGGAFSGDWRLVGERLEARGVIENLSTRFSGSVRTGVGNLPLSGRADSGGVRAQVSTLNVTAGAQGVRVQGPLRLALAPGLEVSLGADLSYRNGEFSGTATADTPYLSARLEGRRRQLWATTRGYAELSGPVFPDTRLSGRLTLPDLGALQIPNLPMRVTRNGATLGESRVEFKPGFPFRLALPARISGMATTLRGMGTLDGGSLALGLPWGEVRGSGSWRDLRVTGELAYASLAGQLGGSANLLEGSYALRLAVPKLDGALRVFGQGANLNYAGSFQGGRLDVSGAYRALEGLTLRVNAENFDLEPLGIPFGLSGSWGSSGGELRARTAYGNFAARGRSLLGPVEVTGLGQWGRLFGTLDAERVSAMAQVKLPGIEGQVSIAGPWGDLEARGQGRYDLPYLDRAEWRLEANLNRQTWQLSGPLALFGRGLAYRGQIGGWGYRVAGERGELEGRVFGQGTEAWAEVQTTYPGDSHQGLGPHRPLRGRCGEGRTAAPPGEAHLADGSSASTSRPPPGPSARGSGLRAPCGVAGGSRAGPGPGPPEGLGRDRGPGLPRRPGAGLPTRAQRRGQRPDRPDDPARGARRPLWPASARAPNRRPAAKPAGRRTALRRAGKHRHRSAGRDRAGPPGAGRGEGGLGAGGGPDLRRPEGPGHPRHARGPHPLGRGQGGLRHPGGPLPGGGEPREPRLP